MPVFLLGGFAVLIRGELDLTESALGLSASAFFLGAAVGSLPGAVLANGIAMRRAIRAGATLTALTLIATSVIQHPTQLMALMALAGFANSVSDVTGVSRAWLADGTADWLWPAAEEHGIPIMVFAPGQTDLLGPIARAHPRVRLVIDHLGIPSDTRDVDLEPIIAPALALSDHPNVAVKASALPCCTSSAYPFEPLHRVIRRVVDTFGPHRVFWGTDLTRLPCSYGDAIRLFMSTGVLGPGELDLVMGRALLEWLEWA